jgi:uncharacterized protein (TIGR02246 family)
MLGNSPFDFDFHVMASKYDDSLNTRSEQDTIQNWLDTVCNHNALEIVKLYAPDGVLLGTVAKNIKVGQSEIQKYFDMFVKKKPCGMITSMNVQRYGDIAIVDGTYTFELKSDKGGREKVPARYTFVLRRVNHQWLIATHHSSAQP